MSKDYREQSQLEDDADEKYLTIYQYFKELTDYERGEYDALHGYPVSDADESPDYLSGYGDAYTYLQTLSGDIINE